MRRTKTLTLAQARKRANVIRRQLCELSRDGWRHAKACDYQPLERELTQLDDRLRAARRTPHAPTINLAKDSP